MTAVATCPQCRLQLSVPDAADALSVVRCPVCRTTFQLGEVAIAPVLDMILVNPPEAEQQEDLVDDNVEFDQADEGEMTLAVEEAETDSIEPPATEDDLAAERDFEQSPAVATHEETDATTVSEDEPAQSLVTGIEQADIEVDLSSYLGASGVDQVADENDDAATPFGAGIVPDDSSEETPPAYHDEPDDSPSAATVGAPSDDDVAELPFSSRATLADFAPSDQSETEPALDQLPSEDAPPAGPLWRDLDADVEDPTDVEVEEAPSAEAHVSQEVDEPEGLEDSAPVEEPEDDDKTPIDTGGDDDNVAAEAAVSEQIELDSSDDNPPDGGPAGDPSGHDPAATVEFSGDGLQSLAGTSPAHEFELDYDLTPTEPPSAEAIDQPDAPPDLEFNDAATVDDPHANGAHLQATPTLGREETQFPEAQDVDSDRSIETDHEPPSFAASFDQQSPLETEPVGGGEPAARARFLGEPTADEFRIPLASQDDRLAPDLAIAAERAGRRRRDRSLLRTMMGVVLGGVGGLTLGYYLLLILAGPQADMLNLAGHLPAMMLPTSFDPATPTEALASNSPGSDASEPAATGEMQASYSTATPPDRDTTGRYSSANANSSGADRYGMERATDSQSDQTSENDAQAPAPFDEPAATPLNGSQPMVVGAPHYSYVRLSVALAAAEETRAGLVEGDIRDPAYQKAKAIAFARMCDLAQALTYLDRSDDPADDLVRLEAQEVFRKALLKRQTWGEVALLSTRWIGSSHRPHGGVLLVGKRRDGLRRGDVYEYRIDTGGPEPIFVLTTRSLDKRLFPSDGFMAVAGSVVDNPRETVVGYEGSLSQAVWAGHTLPLEGERGAVRIPRFKHF